MKRSLLLEAFFDEGHEHVGGDGDPDLGFHGVLRSTEEPFDAQMLLDPFEEDLHLPALLIKRADGGGREIELIGKEQQGLTRLGILEANPAQMIRIVLATVEAIESDRMVAKMRRASKFALLRVTKKAPARCKT